MIKLKSRSHTPVFCWNYEFIGYYRLYCI